MERVAVNVHFNGTTDYADVEFPNICPLCGQIMTPKYLEGNIYGTKSDGFASQIGGTDYIAVLNFKCTDSSCKRYYSLNAKFNLWGADFSFVDFMTNHYQSPVNISISKEIQDISPDFARIYIQAYKAETWGLNDLTGMGYRRSLEFLVKDYLYEVEKVQKKDGSPYTKKEIYHENFAAAINMIPEETIRKTAKAAAWIANDYTHTEVKWTEESVDSVKEFISAITAYIQYKLSIGKANVIVESYNSTKKA